MRILIALLVPSIMIASSAIACDSYQGGRSLQCQQLIIRNAPFADIDSCCAYGDPWIAANHMRNCCLEGTDLRDCSDRGF
jgi:hypothetical protein